MSVSEWLTGALVPSRVAFPRLLEQGLTMSSQIPNSWDQDQWRKRNFLAVVRSSIVTMAIAGAVFICPVATGQSVTGKIIIDGVVYGEDGEGSSRVVRGSGVLGHEDRDIGDFHEIVIDGGVDVKFTRDDDVSFSLSGDDNLLELITSDVKRGVLHIGSKKSYQSKLPVVATLTAPSLSAVEMNGSGDLDLNDLNESSLDLDLNGSGGVVANGDTDEFRIRVSGSGSMDAKRLRSKEASVQITGSGDIEVNATDSLDVSIIGSGNVVYYGNPKKVEPNIIGSGNVGAGD